MTKKETSKIDDSDFLEHRKKVLMKIQKENEKLEKEKQKRK